VTKRSTSEEIERLKSQIFALEQLLEVQERTVHHQSGRLEKAMEELVRSREALREQTRILESILDSMSEGVVVADEGGKFLVFNPAAEELVGIGKIEADPGDWPRGYGVYYPDKTTLYPYEDLPLLRAIRGEETDDVELFIRNPSVPEGILICVSGRPVKEEPGTGRKGVIVFHDITERRRAEEALKNAAAELARSNAELEQFAYVASHDLQEPLRMVASFTTLLERRYRGKLDSNADEFIAHAVDGARRMQTLIRDLLDYSRLGSREMPFKPTDCEAILDRVQKNLQVAMEDSSAVITHDPLPEVMGDSTQITQLLQNLISNAIKFRREEPPRIHISAEEISGEWIFSVRDNGMGIEEDHKKRIFLIFQRLHSKSDYPGTGIGLAICKKIVERNGGRIWLESEPGKGTVFYFSIPK